MTQLSLPFFSDAVQQNEDSLLLQQQRKKAEEQILLYQRMMESAKLNHQQVESENFPFSKHNSFSSERKMESSQDSSYQQSYDYGFMLSRQPNLAVSHPVPANHFSKPSNVTLTPGTGFVYQVQFKACSRYFVTSQILPDSQFINVGEFVVVEAERGQDLGVVTSLLTSPQYTEKRQMLRGMNAENSRVRRILRTATLKERQSLVDKHKDEQSILQYCCQLAMTVHGLPISVHEAEYQFDKKKLTIYYDSATRVDFRELVRDLYAACKVRIWMEKINPFEEIDPVAAMALSTGVSYKK